MTLPRVTVDTNLLASGVVRQRTRPDAAPVQLLAAWRAQRLTLILSDHLLGEVERTLAKPYFAHRLSETDRRDFATLLRTDALLTPLTSRVVGVASHPEDDLVVATARSGAAQFLVTGDHRLLALKEFHEVVIVSAPAFLAMLPGLLPDERVT